MQSAMVAEITSASENRQAIYSLLARLYSVEPTNETLKELVQKRGLFSRLADDPEIRGTEMAEGFRMLAEFAGTLEGSDLEAVRLELAIEYAGLFLGVRQLPPHPSESVYVTHQHLMMQKPRDEVLELYRTMGLEKIGEFNEPEDHIAIELQFMAHLCRKTVEALKSADSLAARKYLEVQRIFLDDHLAKWVPQLVTDIHESARREFYRAIAKITKGHVMMDKDLVLEMIENLSASPGSETYSKL